MGNKEKLFWAVCSNENKNFRLQSGNFRWHSIGFSSRKEAEENAKVVDRDPKRNYAVIPFYEDFIFARTKIKRIRDTKGRSWRIPDNERVNEKNFENLQRNLQSAKTGRDKFFNEACRLQRKMFEMKALSKKASLYHSLTGFFLGTTIGSFLVLYSFGVGWL